NQRVYLAEITTARKSLITFAVRDELPVPEPAVEITLLPALIKFDRFEWLVEKATELGVTTILPFEAKRTEHGLTQAALKRLARWEKIALEASQQSRRAHLPVLKPPIRFEIALQTTANTRLLLDEDPGAAPILTQLRSPSDHVAFLIGPEGGWTDQERDEAIAAGWLPSSFGSTVLRAETAAIAGLAIIQAAWEESRSAPAGSPQAAS
ncbi:MAG: 16S rRNA (uracil(1498)-N(3))-methyltransferase, partial [Acidobacteriaceae bacterium]|nr:16S rRNA (uracil(1498)-N(3))-methyltransferase [Acidobacteriaceae bacterium]